MNIVFDDVFSTNVSIIEFIEVFIKEDRDRVNSIILLDSGERIDFAKIKDLLK